MGMEFEETFEDRFKELRKEKNLTQGEIAKELGVSKASVAMWETGQRTPPLKTLNEIAEYFDCRLDYLLGTSDDRWTSYEEYSDAKSYFIEKKRAEEADWAFEARDYYRSAFRKFASLDSFGRSLVLKVMDEEVARCRAQETLEEDTSWLQINVQLSPRRSTIEEVRKLHEEPGVDMEEYHKHQKDLAMSDD